ncbi:uncharacterized protein [Phyllobates terribilis]|uniref:uncharacterized protein n=1 Tax=Phyllobates terribilis TaxID=111132 RepID=UPI003CCB189A
MESWKGEMLLSKPFLDVNHGEDQRRCSNGGGYLGATQRKVVCVTSGNSYFGAHLIKELSSHGYLIRATIQNPGDLEEMKRTMGDEEMSRMESVVVAKIGNLEGLCEAFRGCHAVFHTSSFIDPHGVSGYTERTAFLEAEGARNVIEACGRTSYVKRCIFTSSLLASIWSTSSSHTQLVDESFWSDEDYCRDNKLWLALGKTRAEKIAWEKSKEMKVKLVTMCPALVMAPSFPNAQYETSLPYLKGGKLMFRRGMLAVEDVTKLAKAHVKVYEAMDHGNANGRYICFERVLGTLEDVARLETNLKVHGLLSGDNENETTHVERLTNQRITKLLAKQASTRWTCES